MSASARVVLASASPRRRQILSLLGIPFDCAAVDVDETPLAGEAPKDLALRLAIAKAEAGAAQFRGAVVLGADTVVELGGESLGKPRSAAEAVEMLHRLRGARHRVMTGVALSSRRTSGTPTAARLATTDVWMRQYSDEEIRDYVETGDPFDKAGSYAIQDATFRPVHRVSGCYLNVVGFPLPDVYELLRSVAVQTHVDGALLDALCPGCVDRPVLLD